MDFLLEVGSEEIPARFLPPAMEQLSKRFAEALAEARLGAIEKLQIQTYCTPRRLVLIAGGLPQRAQDLEEVLLGPKVEVAFDKEGKPTKAGLGFAKSRNVDVASLERISTPKGEVLGINRTIEGKPTQEVLGELVRGILSQMTFPKTMRWGSGEHKFARPVHWIVALLDDQVLDFEFASVRSSGISRGHRITQPEPFEVKHIGDFISQLAQRDVVLDPNLRQTRIIEEAENRAREVGGQLIRDESLEQEVTYLTECPVVIRGNFEKHYLELPRSVLVAAMRNHQRYFSIEDQQGQLTNAFVAVSNTKVPDPEVVRRGYERVLEARLADASFFSNEDQKQQPAQRLPALQDMLFQSALGSYYDKTIRIGNLAVYLAWLCGLGKIKEISRVIEALTFNFEQVKDGQERFSWSAARAAILSKTDLLTEMVGEFPELQGEMGGEYLERAQEEPQIAQAVREQYLPRHANDRLPETDMGAILSIADRIDTLTGCFGIGLRPTGGADPYALRRQCLGIIAIVTERNYRFSLKELIQKAVVENREKIEAERLHKLREKERKKAQRKKTTAKLPTQVEPFEEQLVTDLLQFFHARLRVRFAQHAPGDVVDAVLAAKLDDITEAKLRVEALARFCQQPAFVNLATTFKRVGNIIKGFEGAVLDSGLLENQAEIQLHQIVSEIAPTFEKAIAENDFDRALDLLAQLRPPVDRFFEDVLVNDPNDLDRTTNRKALLSSIAGLFGRIADFGCIQSTDED